MNLEDVAKQAGVSRSTVSRVINNEPYVSEKTRTRVLEIIDRLNFSPNHAARTLVTQRSRVIGVVVATTANVFFGDNSYFPMLLQGVAEATNARDHSMLLWLGQPDEDREHFSQRIMRNRVSDGLIIASITDDDPLFDRLISTTPHFVMVERPMRYTDRISYVSVDNVHAGQMATDHLIKLGRRRIAHLTGHLNISDGRDRLAGYKKALERAAIPFEPDLVYSGQFTYDAGYMGMKVLLQQKPDAVFAAGDTAAIGALQAIHEAGLRVPDDIGVVGFDDLDVATQSVPQLTTIRQPIQQKGATTAALLMDLIEGRVDSPQQVLLPTQLVIRQSCGATL